MPGFSKNDQIRLSALLLGHTGKLGKLSVSSNFIDWRMLFSLRLALVLSRKRVEEDIPTILVQQTPRGFKVSLSKEWLENHTLTEYSLRKEAEDWSKVGKEYEIDLY
jgi:exopolyphosphatase/guanosine-5'-triphosphate,3'-diphosphate pyrophosphatase